jgi:hypothetical protein
MEIEEEIASYLQEKSTKLIVTHSQKENCTLSCGVIGVHFMRTRYSKCNCSEDTVCPLSFKVNYCQKSKHSEIFEEPDKLVECINKDQATKTRGNIMRSRIEEFCKEDADITPKIILNKLKAEKRLQKVMTNFFF